MDDVQEDATDVIAQPRPHRDDNKSEAPDLGARPPPKSLARIAQRVVPVDPTTATAKPPPDTAETPFLVVRVMHDGDTRIFATGVYLDTLRAAGDDLKFAKRIVVCDSSRVDTLMALPL